MKTKPVKRIPFDFVLDLLAPAYPVVKPMFGAYGVYVGPKIVLILRSRPTHTDANGVWIATDGPHHASLRKQLPGLKTISILSDGKSETKWQMLAEDADDFEPAVVKVCDLILAGDSRIGNIPKGRKKKKTIP